jgi:RNA polymerase sigma factor (sigma-70 family)
MAAATNTSLHETHALYEDHHGWLQSWLRRRLGNAADAADLAHDAFVRLIVKPAPRGFATPLEARSYLKRMAQGMCVDLWRRREVEQAWLDALAAKPELYEPCPEHRAIVVETLVEIDAWLGQLPEKVGHAFILAQIHGTPTREIAAELAVSERMVQKYLARAMLHLALIDAGLDR